MNVVPYIGNVDWNREKDIQIIHVRVVPYIGNVDWNSTDVVPLLRFYRRSLHWERGLKFKINRDIVDQHIVVPYIGNVDWNIYVALWGLVPLVVPYIGNVDWNISLLSPWEGISVVPYIGNVDWNRLREEAGGFPGRSFPTLGTWIEILSDHGYTSSPFVVVPYIGNVDWNSSMLIISLQIIRRSLHWERGLKSWSGRVYH